MNATLTIIFVSDVSKIMHHPASITMNDFGDCYDQVAHTIRSVALRADKIPKPAVKMMILPPETMQFCLQMSFRESTKSFGGSLDNPTLGLGMGNGAGPPAFAVVSTLIKDTCKRMGHEAKLMSVYMARFSLLAIVMYDREADLLQMIKSPMECDEELIE